MLILMFVEKTSTWALKLHRKLVFENDKILRFQNRTVAACFTTICLHMRGVHHPQGGLTCNFNGVIAGIQKLVQIYVCKMLV